MGRLKQAFSLTPDYLQSREPGAERNLMDTGVQLGRRFRALKLWMVLRYFGADGIRRRLAEHMRLARVFADWVDADNRFERVAPAPFSVVCFRANPTEPAGDLDDLNARLLDAVNATGEGVPVAHASGRPLCPPASRRAHPYRGAPRPPGVGSPAGTPRPASTILQVIPRGAPGFSAWVPPLAP